MKPSSSKFLFEDDEDDKHSSDTDSDGVSTSDTSVDSESAPEAHAAESPVPKEEVDLLWSLILLHLFPSHHIALIVSRIIMVLKTELFLIS